MIRLLETLPIVLWSVFFLVPVGRGQRADLTSAEEFEAVFQQLYEAARRVPFDIKTTEAQHYRRYVLQRRAAEQRAARREGGSGDISGRPAAPVPRSLLRHPSAPPGYRTASAAPREASMTVRASCSSHTGAISTPVVSCPCPQGISAGNRSPTSISTRRCSWRSATAPNWEANAESASFERYAEDPAPAHSL
jgi:hypothetical protein